MKRVVVRLWHVRWLLALDLIAWCGGFGSGLYLWTLRHAAQAEGD